MVKTTVDVVNATISIKPEFNGERIKNIRKKIHVTQKGLTGLIGFSIQTVESWKINQTMSNRSS